MLQNKQIRNNVVVFSQWSRKSYAIFASLKKVVSIARLSIDICISAILKSPSAIHFIKLFNLDDDETESADINETIESSMLLIAALPVISNGQDIYSRERINNYAIKKPMLCQVQSMGFLYLNAKT